MTRYSYTDSNDDRLWVIDSSEMPNAAFLSVVNEGSFNDVYIPADKVDEVCAALRDAAGLPPVWTVEKRPNQAAYEVLIKVSEDGLVNASRVQSLSPNGTRAFAKLLLAAADEAEASRPKLPTAVDSVIKIDGKVHVRGDTYWQRTGLIYAYTDEEMARHDFTVLHDPDKESKVEH